jgi:hypothetical protein
MTRDEALQFVAFLMDDGEHRRKAKADDVAEDDLLVGFHQLHETIVVVVRSSLPGVRMDEQLAKDLARDYLTEIGWFGEESLEAIFVL